MPENEGTQVTTSDSGSQHLDKEGLFDISPNAMMTWTRRRIDPTIITPDQVDVLDIAHGISRQCRYNGHTFGHLSVARHCIWVSDWVAEETGDRLLALTGLLHDASEAYIGDMIRPLKHNPKLGTAFGEIDTHVETQIAARFGIPYPYPQIIKDGDAFVLTQIELNEARIPGPARWTYDGDALKDEQDWLNQFVALGGK